jgi:adenylate cyclase
MTAIATINSRLPRAPIETVANIEGVEDGFAFASLGSEKLRVMVLLVIIAAAAVFSLVPPTYFSPTVAEAFHGNLIPFIQWRFVLLAGLVLYLVAEHLLVSYLIKNNRQLPHIYHYFTATIETSCPTVAIMLTAMYTDPSSALSTIPSFAYPLFIVLSALRLNFRLSIFTGALAAIEYVWVAQTFGIDHAISYGPIHVSKAIAFLLLGIITGLVAMQIKKGILVAFRTSEERNEVVSMFGKHVSPAVVDELLAYGSDLPSEKKEVCVMFLDIRNFTTYAEKRTPEEVVSYLEKMFEFMIEIVNRNHGIINKFLGDGFMAVFGAPVSHGDDCLNAVTA